MTLRFGDLVKLLLLAFFLLLVLRFAGAISRVLLLIALVIVLAMILTPPVSWLERHRVARFIGAPFVALTLLAALTILGLWLLPPLLEQVTQFILAIPGYWERAEQWLTDFTARYPRVQRILTVDEQLISGAIARLEAFVLQAGLFTVGILSGLAALILVFVMTIFTVALPRPLLNGLFALLSARWRRPVAEALHTSAQQMRVWVWSSALVGLINGTIAFIALTLLGVQPALLLASLVFFGEFFPYIGPIGAAIPAVLLALLVSPLTALWTLLVYVGIQQLESSVLSPLIVSGRMKFHPLSVAFALLAMGELFGLLGAILAIPALATVKAFYEALVLQPKRIDQQEIEAYSDVVVESHRPAKKEEDEEDAT